MVASFFKFFFSSDFPEFVFLPFAAAFRSAVSLPGALSSPLPFPLGPSEYYHAHFGWLLTRDTQPFFRSYDLLPRRLLRVPPIFLVYSVRVLTVDSLKNRPMCFAPCPVHSFFAIFPLRSFLPFDRSGLRVNQFSDLGRNGLGRSFFDHASPLCTAGRPRISYSRPLPFRWALAHPGPPSRI